MDKVLKAVLIGAGNRGETYTDIMLSVPDKFRLVAVVDPVDSRRNNIMQKHHIPEEMCFRHWDEFFAKGKIADMVIISTQDQLHFEPAMKAIALQYDLLLEKPVSPDMRECERISQYAKEQNVKVVVCHVLRYTPFFGIIKNLIDSGKIGDVVSVNHEEAVGNVHQSHSFVRGNWGNEQRSAPMLLAKSCHDLDILQWLVGKKCVKIQSFGSLKHFREENAPDGAPEYCIDGCPEAEKCPYNAVKLYLDDKENSWFREACTKESHPTDEMVEKAIRTTMYGRCVYRCDNTVVDHQVVNMLFEEDITVSFTMCAFNKGGRFIHIMGTKGERHAAMDGNNLPITVYDFTTKQTTQIPIEGTDGVLGGHGGGDEGIVNSVYEYLQGSYTGNAISEIEISVNNHLLVFAAEKSRKQGCVVDFSEFLSDLGA